MNRSRWLCCATSLFFVALSPIVHAQNDGDGPPDPAAIKDRCVRTITQVATNCVSQNQTAAAQCVRRIRILLDNGQDAQARHMARRCVGAINRQSHAAADRIRQTCAHCIHALRRLGAPDLAQQFHQACGDRVGRVRRSRQAAVNAIKNMLGGGAPDSQP